MSDLQHLSEQFNRDGFAVAKSVFSSEEVKVLEDEFDSIVRQLTASGEDVNARWRGEAMDKMSVSDTVVLHTHNVQYYSSKWAQALFHPHFLAAATAILGPDIVLHHTKLFQKPAENGAPFPMHQDWSYFPSRGDTMVAAIIHVSQATDEMGCLRVVPGTHRLGRLNESSGSDISMADRFPLVDAVPLEARPGDVVFFSYLTVHGSMPNRSDQIRKTVLVQMHAGDDELENSAGHPYDRWVLAGRNPHMKRGAAN
ncbi:MAG: phytanoyl-CoA dioxygenase family protein [Fimbriimonadaceae bacterium]|nr:phytanoyl-CoA dioxygenase family protein [Fimbriimonadaceae bacterium]